MDPKLLFWTAASVIFVSIVTCALAGWREIRAGRLERHRRFMNATVILVVAFVVLYVAKVVFLGKEDLELWSPTSIVILRIHETLVLIMVVGGTVARILARRLGPAGPAAGRQVRTRHRWSGRTAIVAGTFALLTAMMVLASMYLRA